MEIIGEKINGTRKRVAEAVARRDPAYIEQLARAQTAAGAHYLDINAGTNPAEESEALVWLAETVQAVVDTTLCLDSPNPAALTAAMQAVKKTPMINSISGEPERLEKILPLAAQYKCPVIALAMDNVKIPPDCAARMEIIRRLLTKTRAAGLPDSLIYVDPLAMAVATDAKSGQVTFDIMRTVKEEFPEVHLTCGLSNISFGLPARSRINQAFLSVALAAGLDSAIIDPLDNELMAALAATELVLGHDRFARNYLRAYRNGIMGQGAKHA